MRLLFPLLLAITGCGGTLRGFAEGRSSEYQSLPRGGDAAWLGAARFTYDDFGGLNTDALRLSALPWKIVAASLALDRARHGRPLTLATVHEAMTQYGFVIPASIANWPEGPPPRAFDRPLGLVTGIVRRGFPVRLELEIANLGCASCHAGVMFDSDGRPTRDVWLGLPNTSLDLEAFSRDVYRTLNEQTRDRAALLSAIVELFPETSAGELATLRGRILPRLLRALTDLRQGIDAPAPFPNGGPGLTNGPGALKRRFGLLPPDAMMSEAGFVSVPDLGDIMLRTSLLADGGMTPFATLAHGVAFFTVPSLGNHPDRAERIIPAMEDVFRFLETYRLPRFPGAIDSAVARQGRSLYVSRCASCHGSYDGALDALRLSSFPNRVVALESIGTDPIRLEAIDEPVRRAMMRSAYRRHVTVARSRGYVAPRLTGLWATAPYLHNGSVPTLWHLMNPAERPARFQVGGHSIDYRLVGIAYPDGYLPWSVPAWHDTSRRGMGNSGHEAEFNGFTPAEISALIEFLKLL